MIDVEGMKRFLESKFLLQRKLEDLGETEVSREVELQLHFLETRALDLLKKVYSNAADEIFAMRRILEESENTNTEESK